MIIEIIQKQLLYKLIHGYLYYQSIVVVYNFQKIIIKNSKIRYDIVNGNFCFYNDGNNDNDKFYNMLSNSKLNFQIIYENCSYYKYNINYHIYSDQIPSNFQEFITTTKLNKYNIIKEY